VHQRAAGGRGRGDGGVCVGHAEVHRPRPWDARRNAGRVRADPAGRTAVEVERGVGEVRGAHVAELVAEDRAVELLGRLKVVAHLLVPGQRAGHVGHLRPGVQARLPDAEHAAGGVGRHGHPPKLHDVHRAHDDLPAGVPDLGRGRVGVIDRQVRHPHGRLLLAAHLGADAGHVTATQLGERVAPDLGAAFFDVPAELRRVEGDRLLDVIHSEVHPAGRPLGPCRVTIDHNPHLSSPVAAHAVPRRRTADANTAVAG
jgi:hypothetical protein